MNQNKTNTTFDIKPTNFVLLGMMGQLYRTRNPKYNAFPTKYSKNPIIHWACALAQQTHFISAHMIIQDFEVERAQVILQTQLDAKTLMDLDVFGKERDAMIDLTLKLCEFKGQVTTDTGLGFELESLITQSERFFGLLNYESDLVDQILSDMVRHNTYMSHVLTHYSEKKRKAVSAITGCYFRSGRPDLMELTETIDSLVNQGKAELSKYFTDGHVHKLRVDIVADMDSETYPAETVVEPIKYTKYIQ